MLRRAKQERQVRKVVMTVNGFIERGYLSFFFRDIETGESYSWLTKSANCPFVPINVGTELEISFEWDNTREQLGNVRRIMNVRKRG